MKKKKLAKNGRRRTTMCWYQLPLNRFLFVIVYYSSYITKPSEKFSYLMIIIIINVRDQQTTTLSILWYFVARESTSVMRQEQMVGGMINSICPLRFFLWFSWSRRVKYNIAILICCESVHLRRPRSSLCYFLPFCRCQYKKEFWLY